MNRELEERGTPLPDSVSHRTRAYIASNLTLFIVSAFIGIIGFFAILTDAKYNSSLGSALGNSFGAGFTFGGISFLIGIVIRNVNRAIKRRNTSSVDMSNLGQSTYFSIDNSLSPSGDLAKSSKQESAKINQVGALNSCPERLILFDDLHPWVKSAADDHWLHGHYRDAVEHAARSVNSETQQKVWSYKDGTALMEYVFSMNPPTATEGRRLRFRGDPKTETWRNKMLAGQALGRACYLGLRNIAAHEQTLDWSRQLAFQYLVMFSVLAQWIDECDVTGAA